MTLFKKTVILVAVLLIISIAVFNVYEAEIYSYLSGDTTTITGIVSSSETPSPYEAISWSMVKVELGDGAIIEAFIIPGLEVSKGDRVQLMVSDVSVADITFYTVTNICETEL